MAVVLLGTGLRISRLGDAVSYNEAAAWSDHAHRSLGLLISDLPLPYHHILHDLLLRYSTALFGIHPWSIRFPALLAGILLMPIFYAFIRNTFNRHIALIALCLLAVSGPFVEYGSMARGYALTWPLIMSALIAGRHFVKSGNAISLGLMALCCALAMWAVPTVVHAVVMVYLWTWSMVADRYKSTVRRRSLKLLFSAVLFVLLTLLCYAPVLAEHSFAALIDDPSTLDPTWKMFTATYMDRAYDVWDYVTGTAPAPVCVLGLLALAYAAYISAKYRLLLVALILGSVPLVLLEQQVASPPSWIYALLVLHIGSAIGLFHLLRFLRGKVGPALEMDRPTLLASLVILVCFGWWTLTGTRAGMERFPEAPLVAEWFVRSTEPGDHLHAEYPWDAPMAFALACAHADQGAMTKGGVSTAQQYYVVGIVDRQTALGIWRTGDTRQADHVGFQHVLDLRDVQVFKLVH